MACRRGPIVACTAHAVHTLGAVPLSRALVQLAEHGVEVQGSRITITDKARLRRLARPQPLMDSLKA
jgi:hypothetical protein